MAIEVGAIIEGEVTGITNFGAFMQLPEGKVGLVHISEVSTAYVRDVHDFLKEHQKVMVKVLSIDEHGKIGLSIKRVEGSGDQQQHSAPVRSASSQPRFNQHAAERKAVRPAGPVTFEDKLSKFMKDSDDRQLDLRRNTESKRGGRGASRGK